MISKRHLLFNIGIIIVPWLSMLFIGKRNFKRFSITGIFIVVFEIINHIIGYKRFKKGPPIPASCKLVYIDNTLGLLRRLYSK